MIDIGEASLPPSSDQDNQPELVLVTSLLVGGLLSLIKRSDNIVLCQHSVNSRGNRWEAWEIWHLFLLT